MATKDGTIDWKALAKAAGISVPEAHQAAAQMAELTGSLPSAVQKITSQLGSSPSQGQLREGAESTYGYSSQDWGDLSASQKADIIKQYANSPDTPLFSPGTIKTVDTAAASGGTPDLKTPKKDPAAATAAESPYDELAQSLASGYLQQINQLEPLISGQSATGLGQEAQTGSTQQLSDLLGAAGIDPNSALGKSVTAQSQATDPLQGNVNTAMSNEANANAEGAVNVAGAIANTGPANTAYLEAAPWQQILSELASETAYKAASGQGAAAFGSTNTNTPAFLKQIYKNLGLPVTPSANGAGLTTPGTAAKGGTTGTTGATTGTGGSTGGGGTP